MEFITSRGLLPATASDLNSGVWFNMWAHKLFPYDELHSGDTLYWYSVADRAILWRSRVSRVRRFRYDHKKTVIANLKLGPATEQVYFRNAPNAGFCLSYKVNAAERIDIRKPESFRFPQQGWLRIDQKLRSVWTGFSRPESVMITRSRRSNVEGTGSNQLDNARRTWDILVRRAMARSTITYSQLGVQLQMHPRPLRFVLAPIQEFCLEQRLPPLTILVVNKRGSPGAGFIAWDRNRFDEGLNEVYDFPWQDHQNPFEFAQQTSLPEMLDDLLTNPDAGAKDKYARVRVRGVAQIVFRQLLLRAYGNRCAFSGCAFKDVLQASHIVGWGQCDPKDRLNVRNGILLSSLHHSLFDKGILTITPDYRIIYFSKAKPADNLEQFDRAVTSDLHLKQMRLPRITAHCPAKEFIDRHNEVLKLSSYLPKLR